VRILHREILKIRAVQPVAQSAAKSVQLSPHGRAHAAARIREGAQLPR
jgi:hypothetical protein